jgi:excinuclease UvrABC ATPase subunit
LEFKGGRKMIFSDFFDQWSHWRKEKQEARLAAMRDQGKCPDCSGSGLANIYMIAAEYIPQDAWDCPGCNGSGIYSDWAAINNKID